MQLLPTLFEKDGEIAALREQLEISRENVAAVEIPLSELKEVPRRQRKLTVDQFAELRDHLRAHALISAIRFERDVMVDTKLLQDITVPQPSRNRARTGSLP